MWQGVAVSTGYRGGGVTRAQGTARRLVVTGAVIEESMRTPPERVKPVDQGGRWWTEVDICGRGASCTFFIFFAKHS